MVFCVRISGWESETDQSNSKFPIQVLLELSLNLKDNALQKLKRGCSVHTTETTRRISQINVLIPQLRKLLINY